MKPHIARAHRYWKEWITPGDTVIDATVGNGHDTLYLASLLKGEGRLIGYDIQQTAIDSTLKRLQVLSEAERGIVCLKKQSHAQMVDDPAKLIVYNLGYLPGGNKALTTLVDSTLASIETALKLIQKTGGALSITCYPGHPEGLREQEALLNYFKRRSLIRWNIDHHQWIYPNRSYTPSFLWLQVVPGVK